MGVVVKQQNFPDSGNELLAFFGSGDAASTDKLTGSADHDLFFFDPTLDKVRDQNAKF